MLSTDYRILYHLGDIRITSTKDEFVLADVDIMVSEWMN